MSLVLAVVGASGPEIMTNQTMIDTLTVLADTMAGTSGGIFMGASTRLREVRVGGRVGGRESGPRGWGWGWIFVGWLGLRGRS